MALISLSQDMQAVKIGDYVALNNVWGKGSLVNGTNFTQSVVLANSTITSGVTFNWNWPTSGPYGVKAYPDVSWGDNPLYDGADETHTYVSKISDLKAFSVNLDIAVAAASQYLNVSFDIWLTNKPLGNEASITTEVMVWLDSKEAPWGQKVATIGTGNDTASVYYVADAKVDSRVWDYVAVVYDKPHLSGNIDLKTIMNMLSAKGLVDSSDYVSGYNLGAEIVSGKGSLQINKLETTFQTAPTDTTGGGTIPGDKVITGTAVNDKLAGGAGNDTINGGLGNDVIEGGAGRDILNGGAGLDTVTYASSNAAVTIDLATSKVTGGHATGDVIQGFENATGSAFGDVLSGDASANTIYGLDGSDRIDAKAGNDLVFGGAGDDVIEGGAGSDTLWGGDGSDTLEYRSSNAAVVIDITATTAYGGHASGDKFANFENVTGSGYDDSLFGSSSANIIYGLAGSDKLDGRGGNDTIYGDSGSDTINGGAGSDSINGGDGNDFLYGDKGTDSLWGGLGADRFYYKNGDSTLKELDKINDFNFREGDRIDLASADGDTVSLGLQQFAFVGAAEFTGHAGELRYETTSAGTLISADTTGDGVADFALLLNYQGTVTRDFFII
jgi:Ca2+-binding RTX toxin-like protein